jgi:hypothetical protein
MTCDYGGTALSAATLLANEIRVIVSPQVGVVVSGRALLRGGSGKRSRENAGDGAKVNIADVMSNVKKGVGRKGMRLARPLRMSRERRLIRSGPVRWPGLLQRRAAPAAAPTRPARIAGIALVLLAAVACRADEPHLAEIPPDTLPPIGRVEVPAAELPAGVDPEALRREADALDRHVVELRAHIASMRLAPAPQAAGVMETHEARVRALGDRVQQQRAALPVADGELARLLGMSPDEYRLMLEEVRTAGAEVAEMRGADETAIRQRLPGHLDRLERIAAQLEHGAAALRR